MPPWFLDKSVGIQHFKNDISLSDEQIATILAWVDGGAPEGDPKDPPAPKTFAEHGELAHWHTRSGGDVTALCVGGEWA